MLVEIIKPQPFLIEFSVKKKAMDEGGKTFSIFRLLEIFSNAGGKKWKTRVSIKYLTSTVFKDGIAVPKLLNLMRLKLVCSNTQP